MCSIEVEPDEQMRFSRPDDLGKVFGATISFPFQVLYSIAFNIRVML